ncbi:MAG: S49 family peptidase, partial [Candidatus Spyradenecus sp.]
MPRSERSERTAIIPIHGYILEGCDCPGAVSPSAILRAIDSALASGLAVTLDIDSPGGAVDGVPELADYIARAVASGHTIEAVTRGTCCSAAYWIAAPCSRILATRGATIGNVGCYAAFPCFAGLNEQAGISVTLFSSGELKAAGHPDIPLTEKQAAFLASHVQSIADMFFADVRAARPNIDEEALTSGAYYLAATAHALGFID